MSSILPGREAPNEASRRRFNLGIQRSRAGINLLSVPTSLALIYLGTLSISPLQVLSVSTASVLSAALFYSIYHRGLDTKWKVDLDPFWMALDLVYITALVMFDGGLESPFFICYLANVFAAAFTGGVRKTSLVMLANGGAYLAALAAMGQIQGFERPLFEASGRLLFLFGTSFFCIRGITSLQKKEQVIQKLRVEETLKVEVLTRLANELDEQTHELADANVEIREANRLKSQFLANMSHELRTPLNSIIGFTQILTEKLNGQVAERHMKFLRNIQSSGEHLLNLINDLLDLSKIEAGKMELFPESFEVEKVLDGVRNVMRGVATEKKIEIETDLDSSAQVLNADPAKFKQIVFNLLSNAVKFSPQGSKITMRSRGLAPANSPLGVETLRLDVVDEGIGIAPEDQALIFEEFRQAHDGLARNYGGTGLGLALVRRLVELHGGTASVASDLGRGSTFTINLPMGLASPGVESVPHAIEPGVYNSARGIGRGRILIVEDDPVAYHTLSTALEAEGYVTSHARHGEEALRSIEQNPPDVITLDLVLPGLDGWEVLKELKSRELTRDIPVVIVTMVRNQELGLALGADDFFVKPVEREALLKRICELVTTQAGTPARGIEILLVDDDPAMHQLLAENLASTDLHLLSAYGGIEGIAVALARKPRLIILDVMMPGMSGLEVAHELQAHQQTAHIPIIILTAHDVTAIDREKLGDQIVALLRKGPQSTNRLRDAIREVVQRHSETVQ